MITDYKVSPCLRRKIRRPTKTFAKNRRRRKTFGRDPPATTWSTTKSSVVSHDFHPPPRFSFCRRFSKILERISGASRKPSKRHSSAKFECQNSACKTCILAKLAKLANFEKLAKLALQVCTLSATVYSTTVPLQGGGGRSSERCSEGPDVLLYITEITHNINNILQASGSERKLYLRQNPRRSTTTPYRRRVPAPHL